MNSKKQASKIECARRGSADQANRIREKLWNEKRNKNHTLSANIFLCHLVEKYLPAGQGSLCYKKAS